MSWRVFFWKFVRINKNYQQVKSSFVQIIILALSLMGCNNDRGNTPENSLQSPKETKPSGWGDNLTRVMARPDSITINAAKTAVIVVDMENDFASKGGMFDRAGVDISIIQKIIKPTARVIEAARDAGLKIIYLKMGYHEDLSDIGREGSPNRVRHLMFMHVGDTITAPDGSKSRILIRNSWGTEIVSGLEPLPNDIIIYKPRFSGFYKTELDSVLKQMDMRYLIFTGCTTSICVESTVRDAMFRDYSSVVLEDCTAEPIGYGLPRSNHEASLLSIQTLLGWVSDSGEFLKALKRLPVASANLKSD